MVKHPYDPKVFLLLGAEKYWITSEVVFEELNYKWNWIEPIDERLLDKYTTGTEIDYLDRHPNYTLVTYDGSNDIYRLEPDQNDDSKQVKRHIANEAAFNELGFRFDRVVTISNSEMYTDGEKLGTGTSIADVNFYKLQGTSNNVTYTGATKLENNDTHVIAKWQTSEGDHDGIGYEHNGNYFIAYGAPNSVGIGLYTFENNELYGVNTINYMEGTKLFENTTRLKGNINEFVGTYNVTGIQELINGSGGTVAYSGNLEITKQNDLYHLEWYLGGYELSGIGFIRDGILGVVWGSPKAKQAKAFGISYLEKNSAGFTSDWITIGYSNFSTETWTTHSTAQSLDEIYTRPITIQNTKTELPQIEQKSLYVGADVEVDNRDIDNSWYDATVRAINGNNITVEYFTTDGSHSGQTQIVDSSKVRFAPPSYITKPQVGDFVEYHYENNQWFAGQITAIAGNQCKVHTAGFSRSDSFNHQYYACADVRPNSTTKYTTWNIGDSVQAKWQYSWYDATILEKNNDIYTVISNDGYDWEWDIPWFFIKQK